MSRTLDRMLSITEDEMIKELRDEYIKDVMKPTLFELIMKRSKNNV